MSLPFSPQPPGSPQGYSQQTQVNPPANKPEPHPALDPELLAGVKSAGYGFIGWIGSAAPFVFLFVWSMTHDQEMFAQEMILPTLAVLFGVYCTVSGLESTMAKSLGRYLVKHNRVRPGGQLGRAVAMAVGGIGATISLASMYPYGPSGSIWPAAIGFVLSPIVASVVAEIIMFRARQKA